MFEKRGRTDSVAEVPLGRQRAGAENQLPNGALVAGVACLLENQRQILEVDREITDEEFDAFRDLIYAEAGIALNDGKRDLVKSRLSKRLRYFGLATFTEYYQHLMEGDPTGEERQRMINSLTTNKTDFFREAHHFDFLKSVFLPSIFTQGRPGEPKNLRIWSAGCSTGEEPYTIAMALAECLGKAVHTDVRLLASDIDTDCLDQAREGVYAEERLDPIPEDLRRKYFIRGRGSNEGQVAVRPEIRKLVTFRRINLIEENWPIRTQFDAIFCRNVIIYFDRPTQLRLLDRFASMLQPEGRLFLGHSESLQGLTDRFLSVGGGVYRLNPAWAPCVRPLQRLGAAGAGLPTADGLPSRSIWDASSEVEFPAADRKVTHAEENLTVGDVRASSKPAVFKTVLGSCVAACLFDPEARIGGMNHFALPAESAKDTGSCRFGVHAMELLINEIMRLGGDRRRFQAKVFGGATSTKLSVATGPRNAQFILEFLHAERIPLAAYHLGGTTGWQLHFYTDTGRALVKPLDSAVFDKVLSDERLESCLSTKFTRLGGTGAILF
jgi:chemotaxis protein methyltransferase CheR